MAMRWLSPLLAGLVTALAVAQGAPHDIPYRGSLVYARTTEQLDFSPAASRFRPTWVATSDADGQVWNYHECRNADVPVDFAAADFDDSAWPKGRGVFGPDVGKDAVQRTAWKKEVLLVRSFVEFGPALPKALQLWVTHDDDFQLFLNGECILNKPGYADGATIFLVGDALKRASKGKNLLAARCTNTGGYQRFSLAVATHHNLPNRLRSAEELTRAWDDEYRRVNQLRGALISGYRMPPLLLHGDLQDEQFVRLPPVDVQDLGWWMAMDLRAGMRGGSTTVESSRMRELGDVTLSGLVSAVEPDGWQTMQLTINSRAEALPQSDSKRYVDRNVTPYCPLALEGKLLVRRRLVIANGKARISEFSTDLSGTLLHGKDRKIPAAEVRQRETWKFVAAQNGQDAEFRLAVKQAIERGTARLRDDLGNLGIPDLRPEAKNADRSYNTGRLALSLVALVKGGVSASDPIVSKGYQELRRRVLIDTYSLGNALMAVEALYAPPGEFGDLKQGAIDRPRRREVSAEDKRLMQDWVNILMGNADSSVDPAYLLRFHYIGAGDFDHSVNQYGLLGLYAAHLCGIEIPSIVWEAAANHLIAAQRGEGPRIKLELVDYRTHSRREANPDEPYTQAMLSARACGWGYHGPKDNGEWTPTYGSMTASGITGLAICQAALLDYPDVKRPKLQSEASRARHDGFAWLAQNMTMRYHPGRVDYQSSWHSYYLYGVERAALLSGIALIQDRDWYFEGAMILIHSQLPDGHWPQGREYEFPFERDAFPILFLKQSTMPVLTGK